MHTRAGDQVKIISGNDKGKQGKVLAVFPAVGRILVEGINMKKKHVRPRKQGQKGELIRIPAPLASSRVMVVCPACGRPARFRAGTNGDKKTRICRRCGSALL